MRLCISNLSQHRLFNPFLSARASASVHLLPSALVSRLTVPAVARKLLDPLVVVALASTVLEVILDLALHLAFGIVSLDLAAKLVDVGRPATHVVLILSVHGQGLGDLRIVPVVHLSCVRCLHVRVIAKRNLAHLLSVLLRHVAVEVLDLTTPLQSILKGISQAPATRSARAATVSFIVLLGVGVGVGVGCWSVAA